LFFHFWRKLMTLSEIIMAIQAAEQLIPALMSFVNTIHPPTTAAPTKAAAVLTATSSALQMAGVAGETVAALQGTLSAATSAALGIPVAPPASAVQGQQ
jgi:hypothetical protein